MYDEAFALQRELVHEMMLKAEADLRADIASGVHTGERTQTVHKGAPLWLMDLERQILQEDATPQDVALATQVFAEKQAAVLHNIANKAYPKIAALMKTVGKTTNIQESMDVLTAFSGKGEKRAIKMVDGNVTQNYNITLKLGMKALIAALTGKPVESISAGDFVALASDT